MKFPLHTAALIGAALCAGLMPLAASAQAREAYTTFGFDYGEDSLDQDLDDWSSRTFSVVRYAPLRGAIYAELREVERFGIDDHETAVGASIPLGERSGLTLGISGSKNHRLFAASSYSADYTLGLGDHWSLRLGAKRYNFNEEDTTTRQIGVDYLMGSKWRLAYTFVNARLESGGSGDTHIGQIERTYGNSSQIGIYHASGEEATRVAANRVAVTGLRSTAIAGRHWLGSQWAVSYSYAETDQEAFYVRKGYTAGLVYRW